ncbi:MAG: glycoside hydrolase family 13 protein [Acidobacteriia bacterium]|nr:glycoside hydrolase family 13 protein [Terriglobia bacterium]
MTEPRVPSWVQDAVFYQIFPDRFARSTRVPKPPHLEPWDDPPTQLGFKGGDLLGIAERLDYLTDLGVNAIYLNPIFQSAANHRYHTYDYYHVDPLLGGNDAFRELLVACHDRGIRVVLDGVFNHAGRGFFAFHHILENGPLSPYRDWFHIRGYPLHAYDSSPHRPPNYASWWGLPGLPKFNTDTPAVREYLLGVAEHWVQEGIDGWRLDVPTEIDDEPFWRELRARVKAINPETYLVGEIWDKARGWLRGDRFDALMNYPFSRACLGFFGGPALDTSVRPGGFRLRTLGARAFANRIEATLDWYPWQVTLAQLNLLGSHDTPRALTVLGGVRDRLELAILYMMTSPGAPCIYYGDEIGMKGGADPACRAAFTWRQSRWDTKLRDHVRRLIAARHRYVSLRRGTYVTLLARGGVLAFGRRHEGETLVVVLNVNEHCVHVQVPVSGYLHDGTALRPVVGEQGASVAAGRTSHLQMGALTGVVWQAVPHLRAGEGESSRTPE